MSIYDLVDTLLKLPIDQRLAQAKQFFATLTHIGHEMEMVVAVLPEDVRADFIKNQLHLIDNPHVFTTLLHGIPERNRLAFVKDHYHFFPLQKRRDVATLGNVLRALPEKDRYAFAVEYHEEISIGWTVHSVLELIDKSVRLDFALRYCSEVFISDGLILQIFLLLDEKDRLTFFKHCHTDYLAFSNLAQAKKLVSRVEHETFLKINNQKMFNTFVQGESICNHYHDVRHPIYYALQRAFIAIQHDQSDANQKRNTYSEMAQFFNDHYAIDAKPFNGLQDNNYLYLRDLEAKSVVSIIIKEMQTNKELLITYAIANLITQYSGHFIHDTHAPQNQKSIVVPKNAAPVLMKLSWDDLIYLHQNKLGLRGVTDDDMAVNESKHGGYGDAVSLARFGMGKEEILPFYLLANEQAMDKLHYAKKIELLHALEKGIKWHINICFNYGFSVAFELVSRGDEAISAYDFGNSYLLGKCGSGHFKADQVKAALLRNDAPEWNVETVYQLILSEIKKIKRQASVKKDETDKTGIQDPNSKISASNFICSSVLFGQPTAAQQNKPAITLQKEPEATLVDSGFNCSIL